MKICIIIFLVTISFHTRCQTLEYYDTSYVNGYLVSIDKTDSECLIKPIVKMNIYGSYKTPCQSVYVWRGKNKKGKGFYFTGTKYDSTKDYGPCGYSGFAMGYFSKYEGDTIIKKDCESSIYLHVKDLYFIPSKNGEKDGMINYELKENEYFGNEDKWEKDPLIFWCG